MGVGVRHLRRRELASDSKGNGILQYLNYEYYCRESTFAFEHLFSQPSASSYDKTIFDTLKRVLGGFRPRCRNSRYRGMRRSTDWNESSRSQVLIPPLTTLGHDSRPEGLGGGPRGGCRLSSSGDPVRLAWAGSKFHDHHDHLHHHVFNRLDDIRQ